MNFEPINITFEIQKHRVKVSTSRKTTLVEMLVILQQYMNVLYDIEKSSVKDNAHIKEIDSVEFQAMNI
jgi:hypothetical protein